MRNTTKTGFHGPLDYEWDSTVQECWYAHQYMRDLEDMMDAVESRLSAIYRAAENAASHDTVRDTVIYTDYAAMRDITARIYALRCDIGGIGEAMYQRLELPRIAERDRASRAASENGDTEE